MNPTNLRMEGDLPYSPTVPDDLPDSPPPPPPPPAPPTSVDNPFGLSRSLPAAEEVDIPAQIETRDRLAAEAPKPLRACVAGAVTALLGAAVFGGAAGMASCSCKVLVVGAGFLVPVAVRYFGRGTAPVFAVIGTGWALAGCAAACLLATFFDMVRRAGMPAIEYAQGSMHWGTLFQRAFGPAELLWCAAVVVAAWMLSRKPGPQT